MRLAISTKHVQINDGFRDYVDRRLQFALGRFSSAIDRVDVGLSDENGPRGGIDKRCQIIVKIPGMRDVVVEGRNDTLQGVVDLASHRVGRAVGRAIGRRRDARAQRRRRVEEETP